MSETEKDELIDAQKQVIGILFEVIKRLQTNNCLLYTSPSPRDRQKSRMPSSA